MRLRDFGPYLAIEEATRDLGGNRIPLGLHTSSTQDARELPLLYMSVDSVCHLVSRCRIAMST